MQLLASRLATGVLSGIGYKVIRDGVILDVGGHRVSVVEACSGVRYLLSLAFLAVVFAYLADVKTWMRWVLLAASVPLAIIANAVRVAVSAAVPALDSGTPHEMAGAAVFLLCLMSASCRKIERKHVPTLQTVFIDDATREVPNEDKPLNRLLSDGVEVLNPSELLAVIANIPHDLAQRILCKYSTLEGVARSTLADLARIKGVGMRKAAAISAAFALGARLRNTPTAHLEMDKPDKIYELLGEEMRLLQQESVRVVLLNTKCRLIGVEEISRGSLDSVMAHPREVFRPAITRQAWGLVLVHNHPSGDPSPSMADHQITTQLKKAAAMLEIRLVDHVILGAPRLRESAPYYSFRECGYL